MADMISFHCVSITCVYFLSSNPVHFISPELKFNDLYEITDKDIFSKDLLKFGTTGTKFRYLELFDWKLLQTLS